MSNETCFAEELKLVFNSTNMHDER